MTNTNTAEAAGILAPTPRVARLESPETERRTRCTSVRFRTSTSNISTEPARYAGRGTARTTAASGGTRDAALPASDDA